MLPLTDPSDRAVFQPRCLSSWLFCYFFAIARFSYLVSSSRLTERVSSLVAYGRHASFCQRLRLRSHYTLRVTDYVGR